MRKFELTENVKINVFGVKLFRIKAVRSFASVSEGELGGYVEKEENLGHDGDAWVSGDARVYGDARVSGDAWVSGDARVYGDARVCGNAGVYGNARVCGNAEVSGNAWVYGNARVCGDAGVYGDAEVYGNAWVSGNARVCGNAEVSGNARVCGNADYLLFKGFGSANRVTTVFRTKDGGVAVKCGCFRGTPAEFADKVSEVHGDTLYGREYRAVIEAIKIHFGQE